MEALLSFMYNGEVRINQEHLPEFLRTARSLQVRGLVDFTKENQPVSSIFNHVNSLIIDCGIYYDNFNLFISPHGEVQVLFLLMLLEKIKLVIIYPAHLIKDNAITPNN